MARGQEAEEGMKEEAESDPCSLKSRGVRSETKVMHGLDHLKHHTVLEMEFCWQRA